MTVHVLPLLSPEDRRAKELVLAMAEHQIAAATAVRDRLRRELGLHATSDNEHNARVEGQP